MIKSGMKFKLTLPTIPDRDILDRLNEQGNIVGLPTLGDDVQETLQEIYKFEMTLDRIAVDLKELVEKISTITPDPLTLEYVDLLQRHSPSIIDTLLRSMTRYHMPGLSTRQWENASIRLNNLWVFGESFHFMGVNFFSFLADDLAIASRYAHDSKAIDFSRAISLYDWLLDTAEIYTCLALDDLEDIREGSQMPFYPEYYIESAQLLFGIMNSIFDHYGSSFCAIAGGYRRPHNNFSTEPVITHRVDDAWWTCSRYIREIKEDQQLRMSLLLNAIKRSGAHILDDHELTIDYRVNI